MHTATLGTAFKVGVPRDLMPHTPFRCTTKLGSFELSASQPSPGVTGVLIYFQSGAATFTRSLTEDSITFHPSGGGDAGRSPGGSRTPRRSASSASG
ncbi:hypothetical protein GCM10025867_49370 (plasmid) [Frondihabitans sucicola]|uniref:Uncharacterized protein n=1 Tax=Frondihabitans sucicola TaxID=1268041 RepID=A0ABN6Y9M8_9MICO|nr:hypothetical protein [Frondihabitans sucicola]BDZ52696.1 hypothetical protein GCM10025867_49370 [Frondihabitans sucicola]